MRAAKLVDLRRFGIVEEDIPRPGPGEVLVRTDAVGVCRSDIHYFTNGRIGDSVARLPFTLGHETAGTVVELGPGADGPPIGARVAVEPGINCGACEWCLRGDPNLCCDLRFHGSPPVEGTLREYFAHPARLVIPLGDDLSVDDGVMLEPLAIGVHAVRLAHVEPGMTVAVLGCGPVGLMALAVAGVSGAARIIAADRVPGRLTRAERYGARDLVDASEKDTVAEIRRLTGGRGADIVFEATSTPLAARQAIHVAAFGGTVLLIGITEDETAVFDTHVARRKGLTLRWVRRSKLAVESAIALVRAGRVSLDGLVTHHFPLDGVHDAFAMVEEYRDGVFKAVVEPNR